jgi:hypothetical protein
MSMDFVYDLTEKLEEQKIDHLLITIRQGEKKDTADVFYVLNGEESTTTLCRVLTEVLPVLEKEELEKQENANKNKQEKLKPKKAPKKPRGRPRKKRDDEEGGKE